MCHIRLDTRNSNPKQHQVDAYLGFHKEPSGAGNEKDHLLDVLAMSELPTVGHRVESSETVKTECRMVFGRGLWVEC